MTKVVQEAHAINQETGRIGHGNSNNADFPDSPPERTEDGHSQEKALNRYAPPGRRPHAQESGENDNDDAENNPITLERHYNDNSAAIGLHLGAIKMTLPTTIDGSLVNLYFTITIYSYFFLGAAFLVALAYVTYSALADFYREKNAELARKVANEQEERCREEMAERCQHPKAMSCTTTWSAKEGWSFKPKFEQKPCPAEPKTSEKGPA
jgi:hypothetical protein